MVLKLMEDLTKLADMYEKFEQAKAKEDPNFEMQESLRKWLNRAIVKMLKVLDKWKYQVLTGGK